MIYTPDRKLEAAKKVVENLGSDERDQLIAYYMKYQADHIEQLKEKNKEYQEVFDRMSKFITPKSPTVYR